MNVKDISVIFLLYNTRPDLFKNLKNYKNFKVLVLDQSDDLLFKKKIKNFFPRLSYYSSKKGNKGFASGINFLVKKVKTKYFLCTQPDIFINEKSILKLKKTINNKKKNCVVAVPRVSNYKNYIKSDKKIHLVENIIGAVFLSEKKKFQKLKMFDENFFFYWEDVDLCNRIHNSNYQILINHSAYALHTWTSTKFDFKTLFIKSSNFKFGEYLYQYKNNKLKNIKIVRQILINSLSGVFYLFIFNQKEFLKRIFYICGIFKFLKFLILSKKSNLLAKLT